MHQQEMVRISVEVRSGAASFRVGVQAPSVREALAFAESSYPRGEVSLVAPIEPERYFAGKVPAGVVHEQAHAVAA